MGSKRHKRKNSHVVLVTSDAADARLTQFRIRPWILQTAVVILCTIIGAAIGYVYFETNDRIHRTVLDSAEIQQLEARNQELAERNATLESQVAQQEEMIQILSNTVNQKVQNETELSEQLQKQSTPSGLPLNGSATMEEITEGDPICVFTASSGTMVVATASGTVMAVNDEPEYGHNVWVDHGNGYITIYRNPGDVKVKQGEEISQGTTVFVIDDDNNKLGYQMMKNNEYINPTEMLELSG